MATLANLGNMNNFAQGAMAQQQINAGNLRQAKNVVEMVSSAALGSMNGDPNGQVDPKAYEQNLDFLEEQGVPVGPYRGKSHLAPMIAKSSLTTLQALNQARTDQQLEMSIKRFDLQMKQVAQSQSNADRVFNHRVETDEKKLEIAGNRPAKPATSVAKIRADFKAGLITQKEFDLLIASATAPKNGITINKDGTVQIGGTFKKASESQSKANIYASRMESSSKILDVLEEEGTSLYQHIVSKAPLGNYALTPEYRKYDQAKRDFINATLRQESGAAIAESEFANGEKQYFPQPGDDPATIKQKKANRAVAMKAIREASGPFSNVDSKEPAKPGMTQTNYESMPSGTVFEHNGKRYRKP